MAEHGETLAWRRSSFCGSDACVEVASTADVILVRDADNPSGAQLTFTRADWEAFIAGLRIETLTPPH
ncbi:DUF397 domain-containing protein [Dactylosporangium sp. CA-233914]|uniref:DUF397 domain-containing protein n=1 Tax=Dactylosporangium sp. CA-233914 TaxID=3239934 RepID=UPI003D9239EA